VWVGHDESDWLADARSVHRKPASMWESANRATSLEPHGKRRYRGFTVALVR
jgi:hypothetical protein